MKLINLLAEAAVTPIDPAVGIALVQGIAEPGVSLGLAVVSDRIRPHYQKISDEIYYIIQGQGQLTVGDKTQELRQGDAATIPKGQVHSFINTGVEPCLVLFASGPKFEPETDRFFPD